MQNLWTKQVHEVFINYCKLNNIKYDCIWIELEEEDVELALEKLHKEMVKIDKPVKIYLDTKYVKTIRYSLIDFILEEYPNKLLTWIPDNFESGKDMVKFLDNNIKQEIQNN